MDGLVSLFAGDDVDAMRVVLDGFMEPGSLAVDASVPVTGQLRLAAVAGAERAADADLAMYLMEIEPNVEMRCVRREDAYTVCIQIDGRKDVTVDGSPIGAEHVVYSPGQELHSRFAGSRQWIFSASASAVDEAVRAQLGDEPGRRLIFDPVLHPDRPGIAAWMRLLTEYRQQTAAGLLARSPLAEHHLRHALVHGLLDIQPHTLAPPPALRGRESPSALRRAVEFCEQNAAEPITVVDIAQAGATGVRTLQRAFRHEFGTTPMSFVRRIRLDRARADLLLVRLGHADDTVTDVALRWGFTNLGRFSNAYRAAFGESPSAAARR